MLYDLIIADMSAIGYALEDMICVLIVVFQSLLFAVCCKITCVSVYHLIRHMRARAVYVKAVLLCLVFMVIAVWCTLESVLGGTFGVWGCKAYYLALLAMCGVSLICTRLLHTMRVQEVKTAKATSDNAAESSLMLIEIDIERRVREYENNGRVIKRSTLKRVMASVNMNYLFEFLQDKYGIQKLECIKYRDLRISCGSGGLVIRHISKGDILLYEYGEFCHYVPKKLRRDCAIIFYALYEDFDCSCQSVLNRVAEEYSVDMPMDND